MDKEYIASVAYYADRLIRLLMECENEDFIDDVTNCICASDIDGLDLLRTYYEE